MNTVTTKDGTSCTATMIRFVPFADAGALAAKLLKNVVTKFYTGLPHGMPVTNADQINADLIAFIQS